MYLQIQTNFSTLLYESPIFVSVDPEKFLAIKKEVFEVYFVETKVRSSYGPLAYFSDIFISGKNVACP